MSIMDKYLNKLMSWKDYNEADGTDDIIINIYNAQRLPGSYKMALSDPWCHATISAGAHEVGISGTIIPNTCYCPDGINWFKNKGQWVGRTSSKYNPQRGDIIYYDWGGDAISDHVGAVISVNGNQLAVFEGNKNDACGIRYIDKWNTTIQGYGRPNYSGTAGNIGMSPEDRGWLQLGDKGSAVTSMQKKLKAIGYNIDVDGEYGPSTEKVVRQFQKDNGLTVDGEFGELSSARLNALYKALNDKPTTSGKDYIGKYVKEFESGNAGPTSIGHCGDDGGLSYGTYQFIWAYGGEPGSAQRFWAKYYQDKYGKPTSYNDLKDKWLRAVADDKTSFIDNEWRYVLEGGEYYSQMVNTLKGFFNPNTYSRAMQDCCWSWSVHRGGYSATLEFKKACSAAGISNPQSANEATLLNACYDYRWKNILYNGKRLTRYSPNGGEDSEHVKMKTLLGKDPIDYITPSGKNIKDVTTDTSTDTNANNSDDDASRKKYQTNWVKSIQKLLGIKATGKFDKDMLNYLPILEKGDSGQLVKKIQEKFVHLQYTEDKPNSKFDNNTEDLVKQYQEWHSLPKTGLVNIITWENLLTKRKGVK